MASNPTPRHRPLTKAREIFLAAKARGLTDQAAGKEANLKPSYARVLACRLRQHPQGVQGLAEIQGKARTMVAYELAQAMANCEIALKFAYAQKNSMAAVKANELLCKLSGLLIERAVIVTVDFREAIEAGRRRATEGRTLPPAVAIENGGGTEESPTPAPHEPNVFRDRPAFGGD